MELWWLQIREMEDVVRQSQTYAATLQNYNTSLQTDVQVRLDAAGDYASLCSVPVASVVWYLCC